VVAVAMKKEIEAEMQNQIEQKERNISSN